MRRFERLGIEWFLIIAIGSMSCCLAARDVVAVEAARCAPDCKTELLGSRALDLGGGVYLQLVRVPSGQIKMGIEKPESLEESPMINKMAFLWVIWSIDLIVIAVLTVRLLLRRKKRGRIQYSLSECITYVIALSVILYASMGIGQTWMQIEHERAAYRQGVQRYASVLPNERDGNVFDVNGFWMGKYEVTQSEFAAIMRENSSHFKGILLPADSVSGVSAWEFCRRVSERTGLVVRLPTEVEWEYACRFGSVTAIGYGYSEENLIEVGWYRANSGGTTHPVGEKKPNQLGIFDMQGNVWEWCTWRPDGNWGDDELMLRGGSWEDPAPLCRATYGHRDNPNGSSFESIGFRVVAQDVVEHPIPAPWQGAWKVGPAGARKTGPPGSEE